MVFEHSVCIIQLFLLIFRYLLDTIILTWTILFNFNRLKECDAHAFKPIKSINNDDDDMLSSMNGDLEIEVLGLVTKSQKDKPQPRLNCA